MTDKARIPVILSGVRTPIGRFLGGLSTLPATQLGALTVTEAVKRAGIEAGAVEDVILGNVVGAGGGQAPARQAAIGVYPAFFPTFFVEGRRRLVGAHRPGHVTVDRGVRQAAGDRGRGTEVVQGRSREGRQVHHRVLSQPREQDG